MPVYFWGIDLTHHKFRGNFSVPANFDETDAMNANPDPSGNMSCNRCGSLSCHDHHPLMNTVITVPDANFSTERTLSPGPIYCDPGVRSPSLSLEYSHALGSFPTAISVVGSFRNRKVQLEMCQKSDEPTTEELQYCFIDYPPANDTKDTEEELCGAEAISLQDVLGYIFRAIESSAVSLCRRLFIALNWIKCIGLTWLNHLLESFGPGFVFTSSGKIITFQRFLRREYPATSLSMIVARAPEFEAHMSSMEEGLLQPVLISPRAGSAMGYEGIYEGAFVLELGAKDEQSLFSAFTWDSVLPHKGTMPAAEVLMKKLIKHEDRARIEHVYATRVSDA